MRTKRNSKFLEAAMKEMAGEEPVRQDSSYVYGRRVKDAEDEIRVTDPKTGGQKGKKLAQLGAIDPAALLELAKVAGYGQHKYARYNYLLGFDWSLLVDALYRHLLAFQMGEVLDSESGLPHAAHVAWHALALVSFSQRGLGTDDGVVTFLDKAAHRGSKT